MKNNSLILIIFLVLLVASSNAQETKPTFKIGSIKTYSTWGISEFLSDPKEVSLARYKVDPISNNDNNLILTSTIYKNRNFQANPTANTPNDNGIAISSNTIADTIVSISNNSLFVYLPNGNLINTTPLDSFIWQSGNTPLAVAGDPKVIWDIHENRFVACFMSWGSSTGVPYPDESELYILASKTSNPSDGFYISKIIDIGIVGGGFWLDRPQLALSNQEVLVSCQVSEDGSGISKTNTIIGLEKSIFYTGSTSQIFYLNNIHSVSDTPAVLTPARGEHNNYGPGLYFVSNPKFSFSVPNDTLYYIDLQDDLSNGGTAIIYPMKINPFKQAFSAKQPNGQSIGNNEARIMEAIYYNGKIKSTFLCRGINQSNLSGIKLDNYDLINNLQKQGYYFWQNQYLCYPSIASFATTGGTSDEIVVSYLKSSPTIFPSFHATIFDSTLILPNMGNELTIKAGSTNKSFDRWGDYTGICRKHDASFPTIWTIGSYTSNSSNDSVWVSEITNQEPSSVLPISNDENGITIFPIPTSSHLNISIPENLKQSNIKIYNAQGQLLLEQENVDFLRNITFKIDIAKLINGHYFLSIESQNTSYYGKFQVLH